MCEIKNDDALGSYGKSHDIYVYREGAGAGPHVGEIERGEWCTRRQSVLVLQWGWCVRWVCENHITREIDVWGRRFVYMGNIHST